MVVAEDIPDGEVLHRRNGAPGGQQPPNAFVAVSGELKDVLPEYSAPGVDVFPKTVPDGGSSGSEQVAGVVDGKYTDTWIDGDVCISCGGKEWTVVRKGLG